MTSPPAADRSGRLFGPGLAAEGVGVVVLVSAAGVQLKGTESMPVLPSPARLRWRKGGFADAQLLVEWHGEEGDYALAVSGALAKAELSALLSPATRDSTRLATAETRRWSAGLMIFLVAVPLLALVVFVSQSGRIVDWAVSRIPIETEAKLGREAFARQRSTLSIAEDHPALPMVRELGRRLTRGSPYNYEFHIARDSSVNAFAMPGGFVVFHTGLLESAASAEEVAGVLAHEIQHVERRHGLRGLVHAAGWRITLSLLFGEMGGSVAATWAESLGKLRFSREQESEADALGMQRLVENRIDPRGMLAFFRKMMADGGSVPTLLSTHPASEERFASLERSLPKDAKFEPLPYDHAPLRGSSR